MYPDDAVNGVFQIEKSNKGSVQDGNTTLLDDQQYIRVSYTNMKDLCALDFSEDVVLGNMSEHNNTRED